MAGWSVLRTILGLNSEVIILFPGTSPGSGLRGPGTRGQKWIFLGTALLVGVMMEVEEWEGSR